MLHKSYKLVIYLPWLQKNKKQKRNCKLIQSESNRQDIRVCLESFRVQLIFYKYKTTNQTSTVT